MSVSIPWQEYILTRQMPDLGWNCQDVRKGAVHSSFHSTICVLEGLTEYQLRHYPERAEHFRKACEEVPGNCSYNTSSTAPTRPARSSTPA